jgi:hypothetical protein
LIFFVYFIIYLFSSGLHLTARPPTRRLPTHRQYPKYEYPSKPLLARHGLRPKGWTNTLPEFRERYACYRRDPDLQELHRLVPMVAIWCARGGGGASGVVGNRIYLISFKA